MCHADSAGRPLARSAGGVVRAAPGGPVVWNLVSFEPL